MAVWATEAYLTDKACNTTKQGLWGPICGKTSLIITRTPTQPYDFLATQFEVWHSKCYQKRKWGWLTNVDNTGGTHLCLTDFIYTVKFIGDIHCDSLADLAVWQFEIKRLLPDTLIGLNSFTSQSINLMNARCDVLLFVMKWPSVTFWNNSWRQNQRSSWSGHLLRYFQLLGLSDACAATREMMSLQLVGVCECGCVWSAVTDQCGHPARPAAA